MKSMHDAHSGKNQTQLVQPAKIEGTTCGYFQWKPIANAMATTVTKEYGTDPEPKHINSARGSRT